MSFPRYERYKDSGIEWMGYVPEDWQVLSLGRVTLDKCDGPFGSGLKSEHYTESGVRVVRLQNIRSEGFDGSDEAFIEETYCNESLNGHDVNCGDLLIAGLGDERNTVGRACVAPTDIEPAIVKADCFRFRLAPKLCLPNFIAAQLSAGSATDAGYLSSGSTRSRIPLSVMSSRKIALPSLDEQSAIVAFLGDEIAKIDTLMAEQERLIALLKEKRQAMISHAVTKGLNPDAPIKDSGIEWLGEVPESWKVVRIKHIICSIEQGWSPQCESFPVETPDDWGVLKVGCVNGGRFNPVENKALPTNLEPVLALGISAGDLLISRANTRELVGSAAVALDNFPNLLLCDKLYRLRTEPERCLPLYLALYLCSDEVRNRIELAASGASSSMLNIAQSTILEMPIALPILEEQQAIVSFIHTKNEMLDALVDESRKAIDLLKERRSALISAAVTGKIDVRGLVVTKSE